MKFYHYSTEPHTELLTKQLLLNLSPAEVQAAYEKTKPFGYERAYVESISLFFQPIPKDHIAAVFNNKHPFWVAGKKIYEHVIDSNDLPTIPYYRIVETLDTFRFTDQFDWYNTQRAERMHFFQQINQYMIKQGWVGYNNQQLLRHAAAAMQNYSMLDYYRIGRALDSNNDNFDKYAANVPHVMVYPTDGKIPVESVQAITLGKSPVDPLLYHLSFNGQLPKTLTPKQPDTVEGMSGGYAEDLPPRVSFAPSIQKCFTAIYPNISHLIDDGKERYIHMSVYMPIKPNTIKQIPESIVKEKIWDAWFTDEVCFTQPVNIVKVGEIRILNPYHSGKVIDITGNPYNNPFEESRLLSPVVQFTVTKSTPHAIIV